ncbi:MAG TPA: AraC family transcriptional regulator [Candidatus Binatia bacterium]|nr:AraC family transcriptional regulator [Candidatus Binatia bacterium]
MAGHLKPRISVAATAGLLEAITAAHGDPDQILRRLGLERSAFRNSETFIATSIFARILEEAARATADDCFGLHFGEHYNPKNIGPLAYVVFNSPTLAVAIENAERYLHIHNEAANMSFGIEGEQAYLRLLLADLAIESPRQHHEYGMAVALNTLRIMAGSNWAPREVQFAHEAPAQTSEHLRVFGAPVLFGCPSNAFVIEREFVERQVPAADPRLYRIMKQHVERALSEMPREDDLLASIRKAIAESMRDGDPTLARVAKSVAMSPRTVQRRLKEYGVEFKELMEDTRRRFALNYLKDRKTRLTEIAFLLGYSEVSAFNRAFKRWTGATPLKYRHKA